MGERDFAVPKLVIRFVTEELRDGTISGRETDLS